MDLLDIDIVYTKSSNIVCVVFWVIKNAEMGDKVLLLKYLIPNAREMKVISLVLEKLRY